MILFLDFDGVLHPANPSEALFTKVPRLANWLDTWPQVDVVISSSWRVAHSQQKMVEMLGPIIGSRVVGCTPWLAQARDDNVYPAAKTTVLTHERQVQVQAWMASSWDPGRAWVALDDMPYLFEPDCARLVVCAGRQGLSRESVQALDWHAQQAGLTRSKNLGLASGLGAAFGTAGEAEQANRVMTLDKYLKHTCSSLPDGLFRVAVDPHRLLVMITSDAFDSHLVGWLVTQILPDQHGVIAYRDDEHWVPSPAPYDLRVRISGLGGIEFGAQVVRLSSTVGGSVAVRLSEPKPWMARED
jgi:HAD domain in Swiss Army Knife RNA repair proteins